MDITSKLETIKHRWEEMGEQLADPAVAADMKRFVKLNKDYKDLEPIVMAFKEYKTLKANVEEAREILATEKDEEMRKMAQEELDTAQTRIEQLEQDIRVMMIPKDPQDSKTPSWKSVQARAAMRPASLLETCSACTPSSLKTKVGKSK